MAPPVPEASKGSAKLQAAVQANIAAAPKIGKDGEMASNVPAKTGAMIPVLIWVSMTNTGDVGTYNRLIAAEVPQAVPLISVPNVSGVIPSS